MSVMDVDLDSQVGSLVRRVTELLRRRGTTVEEPLRALLREIAGLYVRVLAEGGDPRPGDQRRIREAARLAASAGVADATIVHAIRSLTGEAAGGAAGGADLADVSRLVLAGCLAATPPRPPTRVERFLDGSSGQPAAESYTVVVIRVARTDRSAALLAGLDGRPVAGHELVAGRLRNDVVLLIPGAPGEPAARRIVADAELRLGRPVHAAFAGAARDLLRAGHREATDVLDLALAAERGPGLYGVDDFLVEYAAMRDPAVAAKLVAIVRPLIGSDRLFETLRAFVRCGHNRGRTARELCVHRTTVDYRIRRIEELTGKDPAFGRGSQVLSVAVTLFVLQEAWHVVEPAS